METKLEQSKIMEQNDSYLDNFLKNPGLIHLAENILGNLDGDSIATFRLVSKATKECIDKHLYLFFVLDQALHHKTACKTMSIKQAYPKWIQVFEAMKQRKQTEITDFLFTIKKYLKSFKNSSTLYMDPLQFAVKQFYTAGDFLELLLKIDYQLDKKEGNALFRTALQFRNGKVLEILIDQSWDLGINLKEAKDKSYGYGILHVACIIKKVTLLRKILAKADEIDVNERQDGVKTTAFFRACEGNFVEGVEILLENAQVLNIDLNAKGQTTSWIRCYKYTPFGVAVRNGHIEVVKRLLEASKKNFIETINVAVTLKDSYCRPFSIACEEGNVEMAKLILNHDESQAQREMKFIDDCGKNTFHYACESKSLPMVQFLLANLSSIDVNTKDYNGDTAFHFACQSGNPKLVKFLIEQMPNLDLNARNNNGNTPFHLACQNGHLDIVKFMVNHMTCPKHLNVLSIGGSNPFHYACQSGSLELVQYFVQHISWIDFSAKNHFGHTPFHWITGDKNRIKKILDIAQFLISQCKIINIDLTSKTPKGKTPLSLLKEKLASDGCFGLPKDQQDLAAKVMTDLAKLEEEDYDILTEEAKRRKLTISLSKSKDK